MGIGNVKVVFKPGLASMLAVKNGNAICAPVYPAPKLPVPSLDLQDGRWRLALGVDKQLFIERKPVVAAGRSQNAATGRELSRCAAFPGTAPSSFISYRHRLPLLFLFFFRSFQFCAVILIRVILIAQGEQQQPDGISGLLRAHPKRHAGRMVTVNKGPPIAHKLSISF